VEKIKELTASNEFYKLRNSVQTTDRKQKPESDKISEYLLASKSAKNDTKSEEILLRMISELESDKKSL
jgi:hypothetical protein